MFGTLTKLASKRNSLLSRKTKKSGSLSSLSDELRKKTHSLSNSDNEDIDSSK